MAAGVEAAAEVAATEPKMEEESGAPGVPSGNGAPGPKGWVFYGSLSQAGRFRGGWRRLR